MAKFSLRIVDADFYLAAPQSGLDVCFSAFKQADTNKVPIIRIFGATPTGQKTCLHIHQVFPYIYVPVNARDATEKFAKQFATSLDYAIQLAFGKAISSTQNYVHEIALVKGTTFYGYHEEEENFLKIFLYNPNLVKRVEDLLLNGAIMNRIFQPYEGHIPYLLQFFIDYNLYGMNFVHLSDVKFRQPAVLNGDGFGSLNIFKSPKNKGKPDLPMSPIGSPQLSQTCFDLWDRDTVSSDMLLPSFIKRQSTCQLEVDAACFNILNKNDIKGSLGTCPGLAAIWEEERIRRTMNNEPAEIPVPISQDRVDVDKTDCEKRYLEDVQNILKNRIERRAELCKSPIVSPDSTPSQSQPLLSDDDEAQQEPLSNEDIDESQPIIDEDAIRQSSSQMLSTTLDKQLLNVLLELQQNNDASQVSTVSNGVDEEEPEINQAEEELNETITMSQNVYDDVDDDDSIDTETSDQPNGDEEEPRFDDSWSASMIGEIPQMDGSFDIEDIIPNRSHTDVRVLNNTVRQNTLPESSLESRERIDRCPKEKRLQSRIPNQYIIPQLDGLDDADFSESEDFSNKYSRYRKTPKRTYQHLSFHRKQVLRKRVGMSSSDVEFSVATPSSGTSIRNESSAFDKLETRDQISSKEDASGMDCGAVEQNKNTRTEKLRESKTKKRDEAVEPSSQEHSNTKQTPTGKFEFTAATFYSRSEDARKSSSSQNTKRYRGKQKALNKLEFLDFSPVDKTLFSTQKSTKTPNLDPNATSEGTHSKSSLSAIKKRKSLKFHQRECRKSLNFPVDGTPSCSSIQITKIDEDITFKTLERTKRNSFRELAQRNVQGAFVKVCSDDGGTTAAYKKVERASKKRPRAGSGECEAKKERVQSKNHGICRETDDENIVSLQEKWIPLFQRQRGKNEECNECCDVLFKWGSASPRNDLNIAESPPRPVSPSDLDFSSSAYSCEKQLSRNTIKSAEIALADISVDFCDEKSTDLIKSVIANQQIFDERGENILNRGNEKALQKMGGKTSNYLSSYSKESVTKYQGDGGLQALNKESLLRKSSNVRFQTGYQKCVVPNEPDGENEMLTDTHCSPPLTFTSDSAVVDNIIDHKRPEERERNYLMETCSDRSNSFDFIATEGQAEVESDTRQLKIDENIEIYDKRKDSIARCANEGLFCSSDDDVFKNSATARQKLKSSNYKHRKLRRSTSKAKSGNRTEHGKLSKGELEILVRSCSRGSMGHKNAIEENTGKYCVAGPIKDLRVLLTDIGNEFGRFFNKVDGQTVEVIKHDATEDSRNEQSMQSACTPDPPLKEEAKQQRSTSDLLYGKAEIIESFEKNECEILTTSNECSQATVTSTSVSATTPVDLPVSSDGFDIKRSKRDRSVFLTPSQKPPSAAEIMQTAQDYNLGITRNMKAFCSNPRDVPAKPRNVGGRILHLKSRNACTLPEFKSNSGFQGALMKLQRKAIMDSSLYKDLATEGPEAFDLNEMDFRRMFIPDKKVWITPCLKPPTQASIKDWLKNKQREKDNLLQKRNEPQKSVPCVLEMKREFNDKQSTAASPNHPITKKGFNVPKPFPDGATLVSSCLSVSPLSAANPGPSSSTPLITRKALPQKLSLTPGLADKAKESVITPKSAGKGVSQSSQIEGPTPKSNFGFGFTQVNYEDAKNAHEVQNITILSVELHIQTRKDFCPDPSIDPVCAIFYHMICDTNDTKETGIYIMGHDCITNQNNQHQVSPKNASICNATMATESNSDALPGSSTASVPSGHSPQLVSCNPPPQHPPPLKKYGVTDYVQKHYNDEKTMILEFQSFVQSCDPDIVLGYEVQMLSWGYLIERAKELDIRLCPLLSRIPSSDQQSKPNEEVEQESFYYGHSVEFKITGRILLNVWRIMRSEVTLRVYTFENVAFHVLHQRLPKYSYRTLSAWWSHTTCLHRWKVIEYYVKRCRANIDMLVRTDFISRTSELARLFGILFYSVISRGSQYRVESMMLRIAKPMGFIPVSPSIKQRANMAAPECIPLVMEPESRFYPDPVIVLDFQSLYPSIIIAYNYCFSTCLGRVKHWNNPANYEFGATSLALPLALLEKLQDQIHVSPNGVGFVNANVRKGILPRMLDDILNTRIMVKNSMKKNKDNKALHRMLDARQLGLKLIANVTYGYTSANFSGRMPCVEIADSVVRKARETLEIAIDLINKSRKWNARVVYGDTDSVFVLLKGATKERAFAVSNEIIEEVTKINPKPIKLKFEKVYMPCVLQTKKRYMGYMYENLDQKDPVFDAKGIETVRRDSCAAVSKILERSLKILFETRDVSLVKKYVQRQFTKILEGRVSIQDLTFAKEYRGLNNYKPGACVPALTIARRLLTRDKRAEPRPGERVPYVIVYGTPGLPLIQLVRRPIELFQVPSLRLNGLYYITKQIVPSLNRAISLIGVDVITWFNELPRPQARSSFKRPNQKQKKGTISQYFSSVQCPICVEMTRQVLCSQCRSDPQSAVTILGFRVMRAEKKYSSLSEICQHCTGSRGQSLKCISLDCPVFHKMYHVKTDLGIVSGYRQLLEEL